MNGSRKQAESPLFRLEATLDRLHTALTTRECIPTALEELAEAKTLVASILPSDSDDLADLQLLLRTGPFETALRCAIRESGLPLDSIRERLHARGTPVSNTALSYWQTGRRRPERTKSRMAVTQLEQVLGLPDRALIKLLPQPRTRGRKPNLAATPSSSNTPPEDFGDTRSATVP